MKKTLLLFLALLVGFTSSAQVAQNFVEQGVTITKSDGPPTGTSELGSEYTNTKTGVKYMFTASGWDSLMFSSGAPVTVPDQRAALEVISTHNYSGGTMTGLGATTFTITSGVGYIVTGFDPEPSSLKVEYDAKISITPAKQSVNIFINSSGGLLQHDADSAILSPEVLRDNIFLGTIANIAGTIIAISQTPTISLGTSARLENFMRCIGGITCNGDSILANGANLFIDRGPGNTLRVASNFANSPSIPDVTTDPIDVNIDDPGDFTKAVIAYRSATPPGFTFEAFTDGITPNSWDDGSGIKGTVANGKWTIARVFFFNATNTYIIQLGQTEYNMFSEAETGIKGEQFVRAPNVLDDAILLASIAIKQGETSLLSVDTIIRQANRFGEP